MIGTVGLDVGYGFTKATDGRVGYVFPSVVGEGRLDAPVHFSIQEAEPTDDIRITVDGQLYYVGNLAIRRAQLAFRDLSTTRNRSQDFKVLFLSALTFFGTPPVTQFSVVTGLPPGRLRSAADLVHSVQGQHIVARHNGAGMQQHTINIGRVVVVPQPMGTYWAEVLDLNGRVRTESALLNGRVGIVDIGFRTTDLAVVHSGEYVHAYSRTVSTGLANAYDEIADRLFTVYGIERESYALDDCVMARKISLSGTPVDISAFVDEAFASLSTKLLVEVKSAWQLADLEHVILTGGGATALSKHLLPHLPQGRVAADASTANSRGYLAWARRLEEG